MSIFQTFTSEKERIASLTEDLRIVHQQSSGRFVVCRHKRIFAAGLSIFSILPTLPFLVSIDVMLWCLIGTLAVSCLLYSSRKRQQWKVAEEFERDYPAFLLSMASAVKTGLDPFDAIAMSYEMFPATSPVHVEAKRVSDAIRDGLREDEAVRKFGAHIPHPDIHLFHDAFVIARQCGASIAPALHRLARVTRQRQSFRRKSRAAVAMQRLSSYGIIGCCAAISAAQFIANPTAIRLCLDNTTGTTLLVAGSTLMIGGMIWMLQMTKRRM